MEKNEPIITRVSTEDGYVMTMDYGKDGIGTVIVHRAPCTPEEAAGNRRELNRVLGSFGYKLTANT